MSAYESVFFFQAEDGIRDGDRPLCHQWGRRFGTLDTSMGTAWNSWPVDGSGASTVAGLSTQRFVCFFITKSRGSAITGPIKEPGNTREAAAKPLSEMRDKACSPLRSDEKTSSSRDAFAKGPAYEKQGEKDS